MGIIAKGKDLGLGLGQSPCLALPSVDLLGKMYMSGRVGVFISALSILVMLSCLFLLKTQEILFCLQKHQLTNPVA